MRTSSGAQVHPLVVGVFGAALGFVLCAVGFTDYDELHAMFTLADLRMLFTFAGAVAISAIGYRVLREARPLPRRFFHRGSIPGGVLFGIGWAIAGACPAVAFAQLGQGHLWALATLAGIVVGNIVYARLHARFFRFDRGTCG